MTYTALRDIPSKIANLETFVGNSMEGTFFPYGTTSHISRGMGDEAPPLGSVYVVWSYATPIAWIDNLGRAYRVSRKFSVTTSKHQSRLYTLRDLSAEQMQSLRPTVIINEYDDIMDAA